MKFVKIKSEGKPLYISVYDGMRGEVMSTSNLFGTAEVKLDDASAKKIERINSDSGHRFTILPGIPLNCLEEIDRFLVI